MNAVSPRLPAAGSRPGGAPPRSPRELDREEGKVAAFVVEQELEAQAIRTKTDFEDRKGRILDF
ncbi:hypothetical protein OG985_05105 [Streptomyces sp. NBC_00289]|uniref:hypothetical protein n=1 Tax=Streptomyces sp. NBC_00289 TaxID=2975703 RepID=UPI0032461CDA